jgi:hypothetical protein
VEDVQAGDGSGEDDVEAVQAAGFGGDDGCGLDCDHPDRAFFTERRPRHLHTARRTVFDSDCLQRVLSRRNWAAVDGGQPADDRYVDAVTEAEATFDALALG